MRKQSPERWQGATQIRYEKVITGMMRGATQIRYEKNNIVTEKIHDDPTFANIINGQTGGIFG